MCELVMAVKPLIRKPMFLPFAWLQLVLEGNSMSTYLLTNKSIDLWDKCHGCIYDYLLHSVDSHNMLHVFSTKILHQENNHLLISISNDKATLLFDLHYCQNDWYIDLQSFKRNIDDDCMSCFDH